MKATNIVTTLLRDVGRGAALATGGLPFRVEAIPNAENYPMATVNLDGTVSEVALFDWGRFDQGVFV